MDVADQPEERAEARARIIGIYEQQGRLRSKVREYAEAFEADPPEVEAGFFLAEAHLRQKEYAEAEAVYEKLIDMDGVKDEDDLEALEALVRIYERTKEHKKAIAVLEQLAELRPKLSREYYHRIAELSLELYDDDKAVSYAMRAVEQNPDDATARARLADIYRQMQRYEAAAQQYREAIDLDPRNYDNFMKLAELLIELEQYDEAEDHYRTIVKKARDESLILKSARRAIKLAEADARLDEIEGEFSPLVFSPTAKPVHRKIMLELYDRMVSPLITELRYGVGEDREESEQRLDTLSRRALPALTAALQSDDVGDRATAVKLLGELRAGPAAPALARLAVDEGSSLRSMAMSAIARIGDERASNTLVRALDHDDPAVRDLAAWALGYTGGAKAADALAKIIKDGENWSQRALAAISLGRIGGAKAERALIEAARANGGASGSNELHEAVVWSLGRIQSERAVDELRRALEEGTSELRSVAAWSLARVGTDQALGVLLDAFWSDRVVLREAAGRGLVFMAGRAPGEAPRRTKVNEAAHDVQFVDEGSQQLQAHALVQSLRQDARAIDVTPAEGFLARHRAVIEAKVADGLDADSAATKRRVLNDLADMVSESGFGILSPHGQDDHDALEQMLEAIHPELRELAAGDEASLLRPTAQLLGALQDPGDEARLRELAGHERPDVRQAAVAALGQMKPTDELLDVVEAGLSDASFSVRAVAAVSLGRLVGPNDQAATRALLEALDDDYRAVREAAARGLVSLGSEAALEGLGERLEGLSFPVKLVALRALAASSEPAAEAALAPFRDHTDARIRRAASGVGLSRQ
ncbi:MAG: HEAT repeat domain-containing protein [Persicimonas sp.]